jgi:Fuc2NAc and GlcNAc transferase
MLYGALFISSALLTLLIKKMALRHAILDTPNERSSHTVATPRGGGLAIIITFFMALCYLYATHAIESSLFFALLSVTPIVIISLIDDIKPQSARTRILIQLLCAILALYALGGITTFNFGILHVDGAWLNIVALFMLLWFTNLFNFLDGIDGYAASETIFIGVAAYLLFADHIMLLLAIATLGFLLFNWHKASIFMGDVGSASIGFIIAVLTLNAHNSENFLGYLILFFLFFYDATITLLRRFRNGERISQAHKKHMYQRLHQFGLSHSKVVLYLMSYNLIIFILLWLFKAENYWIVAIIATVIFYIILSIIDGKKAFE